MALFSSSTATYPIIAPTTQVIPLSPSPPKSYIDNILLSFYQLAGDCTVQIGFSSDISGTSPVYIRTVTLSAVTQGYFSLLSNPLYVGNSMLSMVIEITPAVAGGTLSVFYSQFEIPLIHPANALTISEMGSVNFAASASPQSFSVTTPNASPVKIKSWYSMFNAPSVASDQYYSLGILSTNTVMQVMEGATSQQSENDQMNCRKAVLNPTQPLQLFTRHTITNAFTVNYFVTYSVVS